MKAKPYYRNSDLQNEMLPVDVVLHPSWWHAHAGIKFDEDFFYHPAKRVEGERRMEQVLHERFGRYGLGADRDRDLPVIGAVHNAAGFMVSEMLGCQIRYKADETPRRFFREKQPVEVEEVLDRWHQAESKPEWPRADYFKVRGADGHEYLLKHDLEADEWFLGRRW
jgi:hypothetical protein